MQILQCSVCGQGSCIVGVVHCEKWAKENRAGFVAAKFLGGRGDDTWSNFYPLTSRKVERKM